MKKSIDCVRMLPMDMINKAESGHPGVVLGFAPVAYSLFRNHLNTTSVNPNWFNRDRFVLASGHASSMLYTLLHLCGYKVSIDDLKAFRQLGSITPGHPELGITEGLDSSSGPLGQGIPMAAGMAIAEEFLAKKYNKENFPVINHYTFVECGDGDLQEGVTQEALQIIGNLKLSKLVILYDSNRVQLDGPVSNAGFVKNTKMFFESLGFDYFSCEDVEDEKAVKEIISKAKHSENPAIIEFHTVIGALSDLAGLNKSHGAPLKAEMTLKIKKALGYPEEEFSVPSEVYADFKERNDWTANSYSEWTKLFEEYKKAYPQEAAELQNVIDDHYELSCEDFDSIEFVKEASRKTIGKAIACASAKIPTLFASSADLTASTFVKGADGMFSVENRLGREIAFGVREHAMGAIANGMTLHHLRSLTGAFFVFSDYMKASIRLAAIMHLPTIFIFTHDSVAVGEDGPTHEPIENLASLRSIPNLTVLRPSDSTTTAMSLKFAINNSEGPTAIILSRQDLDVLEKPCCKKFAKGAIERFDYGNAKITLVGTGSEVGLCLKTAQALADENISVKVVDMVSTNLFDKLSEAEKEEIIPSNIPSIFVEMGSGYGHKGYADYSYSINTYGESGKASEVIVHFGFTVDKLSQKVKEILK